MTATHHAKVRASLRDRFRRTRKPGTTPVAVDGQDVIGTAPEADEVAGASMWLRSLTAPAGFGGASATGVIPQPAVHDADPDWDAILAQYETSREHRDAAARALEDTALAAGGPSLAEMTAMDTPPVMDRPYTASPRPARGPSPIYDHLEATWPQVRPEPVAAVTRARDTTPAQHEPSCGPAADMFLAADYGMWIAVIIILLIPIGEGAR